MSYLLRGIITSESSSSIITGKYKKAKKINITEKLYLLPMTEELFDELNCLESSNLVGKFEFLNEKVRSILIELSEGSCIAYVEAEYFGGHGGQSAIVYRDKQLIYYGEYIQTAINKALKLLGVKCIGVSDEFDMVGLGRHRFLEDWLED